jgi:hypothetical protein
MELGVECVLVAGGAGMGLKPDAHTVIIRAMKLLERIFFIALKLTEAAAKCPIFILKTSR